jgi:hypothetical protein
MYIAARLQSSQDSERCRTRGTERHGNIRKLRFASVTEKLQGVDAT